MTSLTSFSPVGEQRLLAFDTSSVHGSVALSKTAEPVSQYRWDKKSTHSEMATVEIQRLMRDKQLKFKNLTHLSVNAGPGSFTGLRVGLNIVRTLSYSLSLPVAVFNTLEILAFKHGRPGERIFVATKAVQNFFYAAAYEYGVHGLIELMAPRSCSSEDVNAQAAGYTKVLLEGLNAGLPSWTEAGDQVEFLRKWPQAVRISAWTDVKPLYIRASEAEEKMRRGLLKPL